MDYVEAKVGDTLSSIQSMLSKEYNLPIARLGPEQALAHLGIDSLTTSEFMFKLEEAFLIQLADERGELTTVTDLAVLVDPVLQRKADGVELGGRLASGGRH